MSVHGVFVVDKQPGLTSFDVVARVRRAARERRVGHAGTLDPMATGVLVVCLGEATKLVPYLMETDKEYRATARLGVSTDTDDAAPGSKVLETASAAALQGLRPAAVAAALAEMVGDLVQRPPRFCALKVDGERLYDRARQDLDAEGEAALEAELVAKQRTIRVGCAWGRFRSRKRARSMTSRGGRWCRMGWQRRWAICRASSLATR
jgi:tRNA pseudouridine(55) synthase